MRKRTLYLLLICISCTLCGCGIKRDANGQHAYLLKVERTGRAPAKLTTNDCLTIRSCRAANPYAGRNFIYKLSDVQYEQDYYNLYLTPPNNQVDEILTLWFRDSRMFTCLPTAEQKIKTWTLYPRIDVLCVDFEPIEKPTAVVQMYFELTRHNQAVNRPEAFHKKVYVAETSLPPTPSSTQIAEAMSQSLTKIVSELEDDLAKVIQQEQTEHKSQSPDDSAIPAGYSLLTRS